ncbi:MAG: recombinase family protein [Mariprofundaceae bacterium]|nr:recombinase family protein [Mariprofundaceae bacterium]
MTRTAVGYIRVSTDKQVDGDSLDAQQERIALYCKLYGLDLHLMCSDEGVSGRGMDARGGLQHALSKLGEHPGAVLVTTKLDRFSRNTVEALLTEERIRKMGCALHVIDIGGGSVDTSTAMGLFIFTIAAGQATFESMRIGERVKDSVNLKRSRGEQHSAEAPYGWRYEDGKRLPHVSEQITLRKIWEYRRDGDGYTAIANILGANNNKTRGGRQVWAPSTVSAILNNPVNAELFEQWEEEQNHAEHSAAACESLSPSVDDTSRQGGAR